MKPLVFSTVLGFFAVLSTSCYSVMNASLDAAYLQSSSDQPPAPDDAQDAPAPVRQDTVYLKDGSIIHGRVIEEVPGASLKIQTRSGNVYTYAMADIAKITHEVDPQEDATGPGGASSNDGGMDQAGPGGQ